VALEHDTVDVLLAVGAIASPVIGGIMVFFVARMFSKRDGSQQELAKQGDRLNRHCIEIRNIQRCTKIDPFDEKWDR
jgi:hypothetical protein